MVRYAINEGAGRTVLTRLLPCKHAWWWGTCRRLCGVASALKEPGLPCTQRFGSSSSQMQLVVVVVAF